jgi:hypothetical protein
MQALEGDIDTVHAGFLHFGHLDSERDFLKGSADYYTIKQREARFEAYEHEIGSTYAAVRPAESDSDYWRTGHFLMPFYTMNAPGVLPLKNSANAWVPLDDENTMVWGFGPQRAGLDPESSGIGGLKVGVRQTSEPQGRFDPYPQRTAGQRGFQWRSFQEDTTDWLGKLRPLANRSNDYLIDRDLQADMEVDPSRPLAGTYSGIPGPGQDPMAQETMGAIYDRSQEHLGTSDAMIIRTRRALIAAARARRDSGKIPSGVENPSLYRMRSGGALLPRGVQGMELLRPVHFMQSDTIAIAAEAVAG